MNSLWSSDILKIEHALNGQMCLVGGCVRDYLIGKAPDDIDIATPVLPKDVLRFLKENKIKARPVSLRHGVVLAEINQKSFEITTLRQDTYIQDKKEKISFIVDYQQDAKRRDFTFNALYMKKDGQIMDYFDGVADLKNKVVRFIGNPETRLAEDPLRILRYLRFWSIYGGEQPDNYIIDLFPLFKKNLEQISVARKQKEWSKIIQSPRFPEIVKILKQMGVMEYLLDIDKKTV
jgi:poly(A) polymerase